MGRVLVHGTVRAMWRNSDWFYRSDCLFFFQAEDGIRDVAVTGVQTCALPISLSRVAGPIAAGRRHLLTPRQLAFMLCAERDLHPHRQLQHSARARRLPRVAGARSEEHTSELQSRLHLVCRLLLEKKKNTLRISASVFAFTVCCNARSL